MKQDKSPKPEGSDRAQPSISESPPTPELGADAGENGKRRKRGEVESLPADKAVRKALPLIEKGFNLLHFSQEVNGLTPDCKFYARGDLERFKILMNKVSSAVNRLESLLK